MTDKNKEMKVKPIGFVRNGIPKYNKQKWEDITSEVVIEPELAEALDNLDAFSHITILFWTGGIGTGIAPKKVHPQNNQNLPLVGVFTSRSPVRPNPICVTTVKLIKGLDAFDLIPVLDIKPYLIRSDSIADARGPEWINNQNSRGSFN